MFRGFALVAALALVSMPVLAARPPAVVPQNEDVVLERLPRGYSSLASPGAQRPELSKVSEMLRGAARSGDMRLAARADAHLRQFPVADSSTDLLRARSFSAQHRHDFPEALRLLTTLLDNDPRDADSRLARAQIYLVQGRLDLARADCARLALGVDAGRGLVCVAALSFRQGRLGSAGDLLDRALAQPPSDDESYRYTLVMRGEVAGTAEDASADAWFRRALSLAPDDVRTLAAYASYLRTAGRPREALSLLAPAPGSDGLALQRALAAREARDPDAASLAAAQGRRYALAHASGFEPELRDEAEYLLTLRAEPKRALALAQRNFATQRDREDEDILVRSARAAGKPDALIPLQNWAKSQGVELAAASEGRP